MQYPDFATAFRLWILQHPNESCAIMAELVREAKMPVVIEIAEFFHRRNINCPRYKDGYKHHCHHDDRRHIQGKADTS